MKKVRKGENQSDSEKTGKRDEKPDEPDVVPLLTLFRFASKADIILALVGIVASIAKGACYPIMVIRFSQITEVLVTNGLSETVVHSISCNTTNSTLTSSVTNDTDPQSDDAALMRAISKFSADVTALSAAIMVLAMASVIALTYSAENQVCKIRSAFFCSLLRQDMSWFDLNSSEEFTSRITEDLNRIRDGIGEKLAMLINSLSCFVVTMIIAFVNGWEMTLIMMISTPVLAICITILSKLQSRMASTESSAYAKANFVAQEVFSSIKTVTAFGGQDKEAKRFAENHDGVRECGKKRVTVTAIGAALITSIFYASFALALWYSIRLNSNFCANSYSVSNILSAFFCVLLGTVQLGHANPYTEALATARGAGAHIFKIIDQKPLIYRATGKRYAVVEGYLSFKNVRFDYPSRREVPVLNGVSFNIKPGETVALVGASGCGKSTCVQLIQRLYDPLEGSVLMDGTNIKQFNLAWLRSQIGVVGQEPVLFGTTIGENIRYGRDNVTQEEIERAAKEANAYDFIQTLPKKFETMVGERGAQLSGGQKQRIAIARALVRNPKILLLDEATSALDTQNEAAVQKALDKARLGRTTIIVAQRLSTIRNADRILVLENGVIVEQGTQKELMAKQGAFFKMVNSQQEVALSESEISERDLTHPSNVAQSKLNLLREELEDTNDSRLTSATQSIDESASLLEVLPNKDDLESGWSSSGCLELDEKVTLKRILESNRDSWHLIGLGIAAAIVVGLCPPTYAYLYSEVIGSFVPESNEEDRARKVQSGNFYAMMFLVLSLVGGTATFVRSLSFSLASESLTHRLRIQTFNAIIKQEAAWFDRPSNCVGVLCSRLSDDAAAVQGATGSRLGILFQTITTITASIIVALHNDWRLGMVATAFVPFLFLTAYYQAKHSKTQSADERSGRLESARIATEAISNIRTVASLGLEQFFHKMYIDSFARSHKATLRKAWVRGAVYGATKAVSMLSYAVTIYYGGQLVAKGSLFFTSVFKITESLLYGTQAAGQAMALAPDYQKAKLAARNIFALTKRTPQIDASSIEGKQLKRDETRGRIEFYNVHFKYRSCTNDGEVLRGVDFTVMPNQNVAIVGPSGSGKSSAAQLVMRLYDYQYGAIRLDEHLLTDLNVSSVRSNMGIVSQEPVLFNTTLRENIEYGDNGRQVTMAEVVEAARKANIHTFIESLPNGYETLVGERGTQLSGGQKQRVAIARALVRNPKILLLDEATSALDSESEKVVQMALDAAREGRTCITIAHRLSTIQNADRIFVFNNGKVQEQGTHEELVQLKGLYHSLLKAQVTDIQ